jgi:hypothetical protein
MSCACAGSSPTNSTRPLELSLPSAGVSRVYSDGRWLRSWVHFFNRTRRMGFSPKPQQHFVKPVRQL